MIRSMKVFGLALVAVFAMTAVAASAASAASEFTATSYPVTAEGGQTTQHVFTVEGSEVTCENAHFAGEAAAASSEFEVTPEYSNCTAFGFINSTVAMNGCTYNFHSGSKISTGHYNGTTDVKCPTGNKIVISAGPCTARIGAQSGKSSVEFVDVAGEDIEANANVTGITTEVESGFLCPLEEGTTSGSYTGTTVMSGNGGVGLAVVGE